MSTFCNRARATLLLAAALCAASGADPAAAAVPAAAADSPVAADAVAAAEPRSEMPSTFEPRVDSFDYVKRVVMIPMRDGVKLQTVILIPHGAARAPLLLTRTPYGAAARIAQNTSAHLAAVLGSSDVADDAVLHGNYIRVIQDVRGKHGSEGDYVMNRPLIGPLNSTAVDHSTDTYDTIDWLVKNIPESNGKVGILGISYDGFTSLMALFHPHPALRAAVPINAMVDGWMGDDWFHNGAFRQSSLQYAHDQEATRGSGVRWWSDHYDDYETWLAAGSAGDMAALHGLDQIGFAVKLMAHPAYDSFWQAQAVDKLLAAQGLTVPVMLVHSLWDQEDIYGNIAVYKALWTHPTCFSSSDPGFTIRNGSMPARSGPSGSAATPPSIFACNCCGRSSTIFSKTRRRRSSWHTCKPSRREPTAGWLCPRGRRAAPQAARSRAPSCIFSPEGA
jgi:predicted acyl esterase